MRVGKRAHKTCDPAVGIGGRKMASTVHLENIRCNGSAHDGCEAGCLIFWKEAWLKPVDRETASAQRAPSRHGSAHERARCTEDVLRTEPQDSAGSRRNRTDLCVPEHADQVRNAAAAVVGRTPVRGGLHLGQRPPVAAGRRPSVLAVADGCRSRDRRRLGDALDLRPVPARDRRHALSDAAVRRAEGQPGAESATRSAAGRARSRQAVRGNPEDAGLQLSEPRIVFRRRNGAVHRARIRGRAPAEADHRRDEPARWSGSRPMRSSSRTSSAKRAMRSAAASVRARSIPTGARSGWSGFRNASDTAAKLERSQAKECLP